MPAPLLTDGLVALRPLHAEDAFCLYEAVRESLDDLRPWMSWAHDHYQEREAQEWIELAQRRWADGTYFGFAVTQARSRLFLGVCSLSHIHPVYRFCNLGYWIRSSQRGQGFAGRAARLAARYAFEQLGLVRAEIVIALGNRASQRVAEKIGAHCEGVLLNRMLVHCQVCDALMYSLVPSDFGLAARV